MKRFILAIFLFYSIELCAAPLVPARLTCEYQQNPLGIDVRLPRFGWEFLPGERNQLQSAYELIVSDNKGDVQRGVGHTWQPGKVMSPQSIQIVFAGSPLKSFTRYYWRVRVYNQSGVVSEWSETVWFETAMLDPGDWQAKWIGDGSNNPAKDEHYYGDDRMPLFKRVINTAKKIASARLYISGMGYYEAYLNGAKIGDHVLDPGFTTYRKQVLYAAYDITPQMHKGTNIVGIMLGNGWYNPLPLRLFGRIDLRKYQQTGRPCVKAEIHIRYTDGSSDNITTDESWKSAPGPVIRNNVYLGEHYDARLEQPTWMSPVTDASWKNAVAVEGPSGVLSAQMQPAIKITTILQPVRITEPRPDTFIVDLGQNFAGVARIRVKGAAGTRIRLRYGEDIYANGTLNYMTAVCTQIKKGGLRGGPGAPETAWQEDDYILKGNGIETWSPRFTFHGFRYIEITGWPGKPTRSDIDGLRMNADLPVNGSFQCSNDMFNRLDSVIQWTFLSNVFSVQSDCPGREKMGYGGDMVVTSEAFLYHYNMPGFYGKAIKDFANEQQPDGGITEIAPYTGIADRGYAGESGPLGWELAFPYLQMKLWEFYGDKRIIEEYYPAFTRQMAFLESKAVDNLFYWDISDHEALDAKPVALSASSFYYHHALLASAFAGILGKKEDSTRYDKLAKRIRRNIEEIFLVRNTGRFDNATQSAQLFALYYNFSPEKDSTFKVLLNELSRHNWHLSTGIFTTKMLFDVMRTLNRNDIAYRVANQRDFPGWGHMLDGGATTLWETWARPENGPSQNHPMFGSIGEWFYRSLLGINAALPGFEKITIKPQPTGDIHWARGSYHSIRGTISSDWKKENGVFTLSVSIPANTTASVWIPCAPGNAVMEDGRPVAVDHYADGYAIVETGSGAYTFVATW